MISKTKNEMPFFGGSSLLVIFAVLCLTVFALMSLSTIQAEERLVDASEQAVIHYYDADLQAEQIFSELRAGGMPEGVEVNGNVYEYTCPVSETQELAVKLVKEKDAWKVAEWKCRENGSWQPDTSIVLFDPFAPAF